MNIKSPLFFACLSLSLSTVLVAAPDAPGGPVTSGSTSLVPAPPPTIKGRESAPAGPFILWYPQPAVEWVEALAVGNGRLGAMVFGRPTKERLQLNEITVWSGGPQLTADTSDAYTHLSEIRQAIKDGKFSDADKLTNRYMTSKAPYNASYQTLGDLTFDFQLGDGAITDYARWLDIDKAVSGVEFKVGGDTFKREVFSSAPDQVIAVHMSTTRKAGLNFTMNLSRIANATTTASGGNTLVMTGTTGPTLGYEVQARALAPSGSVGIDGNSLTVKGANEATVYLTAGTTYVLDYDKGYKGDDPHSAVSKTLKAVSAKSYTSIRATHIEDYQKFFRRVNLDVGQGEGSKLPTDERLKNYGDGKKDPALAALYYQFGRYLLISSSRPENPLPSNSQGIWGDGLDLPWKCDYKANINFEMNYWPAETANLSECHLPMINLVKSLVEPGRKTAKAYFNAPGWTYSVMTNAWGWTAPGQWLPWAVFFGASGWTCEHLWEHYAFTQDKAYLKSVYPVMKEACDFYLATLIKDEKGHLVFSPSTSPENSFKTDEGVKGSVSAGATMIQSIIWDLFNNTAQAGKVLGVDDAWCKELTAARDNLLQPQIGKAGQLQEWSGDWDMNAPEIHHRHTSHLFALFPGEQISPLTTPALAAAARKSLEIRGDEGTGWSKAWKMNFWARLRDGNHAYKMLGDQLKLTAGTGTNYSKGGGTYGNMFDAHPPFQIDGNFGGPSGINEMLLQSQETYADPKSPSGERYVIDLLPALPDAWAAGKITGLRARGGFEVGIEWKAGKLASVKIRSIAGTAGKIRYGDKVIDLVLKPGKSATFDGDLKRL